MEHFYYFDIQEYQYILYSKKNILNLYVNNILFALTYFIYEYLLSCNNDNNNE